MSYELTKANFKTIAAKLYLNPRIDDSEFEEDLSLIKKIVRRIEKFEETGEFQTRLHINNAVIASNCFGEEFVIKCAFLHSDKKDWSCLYTFLDLVFGIDHSYITVNKNLVIKVSDLTYDVGMVNKIKEAQ